LAATASARTKPDLARRGLILLAVTLGAAALMIPVFLSGHPNVFPDTSSYELVGQWFVEQAGLHPHGGYGYLRHRADLGMFFTMAGARSPFYGLLLFGVADRGSAWTLVALQALAASALVALSLRVVVGRFRFTHLAAVIALLALASTLPFFVSFVMPDVYLGLGALAALLLLFYFDRLSRPQRWLLGLGLLVTLTFHATNPPAIISLVLAAGAAFVLKLTPRRPAAGAMILVVACVVAAVAADAVYPMAVKDLAHRELSRPPFLSARLLADGPGRDYLAAACARGEAYALCRFQGRPMTDANAILWGVKRDKGVFETADHATRLAMTAQESRFVLGTLAAEPLRTVWDLARDGALELTTVSVLDTLGYHDFRLIGRADRPVLIPALHICVRSPSYCFPTTYQWVSEEVLRWTLIGLTAYLGARLAAGLRPVGALLRLRPLSPRLAGASLAVFVLLVANAFLCGALSGVYARYQMRIAWLPVLFAALAWLEVSPARFRWPRPRRG
jgi:hypothetical protein